MKGGLVRAVVASVHDLDDSDDSLVTQACGPTSYASR
jgi:hypothetical protein